MGSARKGWVRSGLVVLLAAVSLASDCGPERIDPGCLVTWSPDGTKAALVPSALEDGESGLWVYDAATGELTRIFDPGPNWECLQPQWSPFNEEILFTLVPTEDPAGEAGSYSVWVVRADGREPRQVARGTTSPEVTPLLTRHSVTWGAIPGTVIFQIGRADEVTAEVFDPYTGRHEPFLPRWSEAYTIEASPSRKLVAALLFEDHGRTGSVFVSEFGFGNWRLLGTVLSDPDWLQEGAPVLFWAPDSSCFVVTEAEEGIASAGHGLRRFDARTGRSELVSRGRINAPVLWGPRASYFLFSGTDDSGRGLAGVFRVDLKQCRTVPLVEAENALLLGWNREQNEFLFSTEPVPGTVQVGAGAPDGSGLRRISAARRSEEGEACSLSPDGRHLAVISRLRALLEILRALRAFEVNFQAYLEASKGSRNLEITWGGPRRS